MKNNLSTANGFTLLEVLIALFVFTLISIILTSSLHSMFNIQAHTDKSANRLAELQLSLLLISRDLDQSIDRPIINAEGSTEESFQGRSNSITLTRGGFANPDGASLRSSLQRVSYALDKKNLTRTLWSALDRTAKTSSKSRTLLHDVSELTFEYLDKSGNFNTSWPGPNASAADTFPKAVKMTVTIDGWGSLTQLYVMNGSSLEAIPT
jgi:general secretion pathway protein J